MQGLRGRLTPADVVIAGPRDIGRIEDIASRIFWYFGNDYAEFLEIKLGLPASVSVVAVGDVVNQVAGRLAPELIELDAKLDTGRNPVAWASSDLAERSPYTSSFYLDCCRCVALVEALRQGGKHLVIADDDSFGIALANICKDNGFLAVWRGSTKRQRWLLEAARAHVGFLVRWFRQRRALGSQDAATKTLKGRDPLLLSWSEGPTGLQTADRYFRALPNWLRERGAHLGWIYNPVPWLKRQDSSSVAAETLADSSGVMVSEFFGIGTLMRAYVSLLAFPRAVKREFVIGDVNLRGLLQLFIKRELSSSRLVAAALYVGVAEALRKAGVAPRHLIYPFENQPWEKALLAGFRRALPGTKLIGAQLAPFAPRFISGNPSRHQWSNGTAPDVLVTAGHEFRDRLIAMAAPDARVVVGGSFRYATLLTTMANTVRRPHQQKLILATCSMELRDSLELAYKAAIATSALANVRLVINFHPLVDATFRETIMKRVRTATAALHVDFVSGSAADWLQQVDLLLYNSATTPFEAAAKAVPMIFVESDTGLDLDNMSGAKIPRGRSPEELQRYIVSMLGNQAARESVVEAAQNYLRRCFSEPSRDLWAALSS